MLANLNLRVYRSSGLELDLIGKQGTTWELVMKVTVDAVALDLTDYSVRGEMRKSHTAATAEDGLDFEITDALTGEITMSMSASDTAALTCGSTVKDVDSTYVWDMEVYKEIPDPEEVIRLFQGKIYVDPEVTRE